MRVTPGDEFNEDEEMTCWQGFWLLNLDFC